MWALGVFRVVSRREFDGAVIDTTGADTLDGPEEEKTCELKMRHLHLDKPRHGGKMRLSRRDEKRRERKKSGIYQ